MVQVLLGCRRGREQGLTHWRFANHERFLALDQGASDLGVRAGNGRYRATRLYRSLPLQIRSAEALRPHCIDSPSRDADEQGHDGNCKRLCTRGHAQVDATLRDRVPHHYS